VKGNTKRSVLGKKSRKIWSRVSKILRPFSWGVEAGGN